MQTIRTAAAILAAFSLTAPPSPRPFAANP